MNISRRTLNKTIAQFATMLLLVSALLPQGMMLARNAQTGLVEITICSGFDSRTVLLDVNSGALIDPAGRLSLPVSTALDSTALDSTALDIATQSDTDPADEHPDSASELCPFALAGAVALVLAIPDVETQAQSGVTELELAGEHPHAARYLHLPSRGPPEIS